jgi:asparagine synthase (glutamine-hydrolysing)
MRFITQLVDQHQSGIGEHSSALWSLLMFEAFVRRVLQDASAARVPDLRARAQG